MRAWIIAAAAALCAGAAIAGDAAAPQMVLPVPDAERGRFLFVSKGCVICHAVNGAGGTAGPALDAADGEAMIDPLAFAARMWRGAEAMAILQSSELGYRIELTGAEIADLAAFAASRSLQGAFSEDDIPEVMRGWTMDEPLPPDDGEWPLEPETDVIGLAEVAAAYGRRLAGESCIGCHVVSPGGTGGATGPAFADIATRADATEGEIVAWLSQPHEKMPEFLRFESAELRALASYIESLAP